MKAYVVISTERGKAQDIARGIRALPGVRMADACWGSGDIYAVVEFGAWKDLNDTVLNQLHSMSGITRTETHVAVES